MIDTPMCLNGQENKLDMLRTYPKINIIPRLYLTQFEKDFSLISKCRRRVIRMSILRLPMPDQKTTILPVRELAVSSKKFFLWPTYPQQKCQPKVKWFYL
jgi:hypothetical protein